MFVKICGITTEEDALLAVAMGADAVGFVFAPSPRQIAADLARDIVRGCRPRSSPSACSATRPPSGWSRSCNRAGLRGAQLHGHETPERRRWVRARVPLRHQGVPRRRPGLDRADDYGADAVLIDSATPGSGQVFDWSLAEGAPPGRRVILAGGLHPDNVAEPIERVRPVGRRRRRPASSARPGARTPARCRRLHRSGPTAAAPRPTRATTHVPYDWQDEPSAEPATGIAATARRARSHDGRARPTDGALRRVRRPVRARDAGAGVPGARGRRSATAWADPAFRAELDAPAARLRRPAVAAHRVPPPVRASSACGVLLKREDLNHTGSHKINNVLGQALLARRMGKTRLVAETGAGQHGVATATAAALFGMECVVYMGEVDMDRQELNVFRMRLLGAEVRPASSRQPHAEGRHQRGHARLGRHRRDHPLLPRLGDGPAPVPVDGARVPAGASATRPASSAAALLGGADPDVVIACVGGGSNAAGIFAGFVDTDAELVGVEPAGGAAVGHGVPGVVHGIAVVPAAGRVRAGAGGPVDLGRPRLPGRRPRARPPGRHRPGPLRAGHRRRGDRRLPAAGPHRGHHPRARAGPRPGVGAGDAGRQLAGQTVLVNLSGRGDKDVAQVMDILGPVTPARWTPSRRVRRRSRPALRAARATPAASCWCRTSPAGSAPTGPTCVRAVADAGADAIEIGIPFSDPVMDGPTIQAGLASGRSTAGATPVVDPRRARATSTPASRWR